jgi:hypothetical protein
VPSEIAIYTLTGIAILLCIIAFFTTIILRKYPVIRASSPIFLGLLCVGSAIAVSSNFFHRYSFINTYDCYLHIWFLAIGYIISYGALFVRTLKIDRLWNARTIDGVELSDYAMIGIFGALVLVQCCLLAVWSGVARPLAVIVRLLSSCFLLYFFLFIFYFFFWISSRFCSFMLLLLLLLLLQSLFLFLSKRLISCALVSTTTNASPSPVVPPCLE